MIPTSIDGTDITGATIDGTDVQEITVDGDVVFSAQVSVPNSVVTLYRFEDSANTNTATDFLGNNDATINGPTYTSASKNGQFAIEDSGVFNSGHNVTSNNTVDLVNTGTANELTMGGWVRFDQSPDFHAPINYGQTSNDDNLFHIRSDGSDNWMIFLTINNNVAFLNNSNPIQIGTYEHVAATLDANQMEFYINGNSVGTQSHNLSLQNLASGKFRLIQSLRSVEFILDGALDDVFFANSKLSTSEIRQMRDL